MTLDRLFSPLKVGSLDLPNRIVMAPMTRGRAGAEGIPNDMMAAYYALRADAGLIITEATNISPQGAGWLGAPGIHHDAQVEGWQKVTEAVHDKGGRIFLQLWHTGRASHPDFQPGGALPVSSSAIAIAGSAHTPQGQKPYVAPRALELDEIPGVIQQYIDATVRARAAGFDGVEVHAANGYLIDQFIRDRVNHRTDAYGGSIPNRLRLLDEVMAAVVGAWSGDKVGVRLSPTSPFNDMSDSDPIETFSYAAELLNTFDLAYLHVLEALPGHMMAGEEGLRCSSDMRTIFNGVFMVNGGYDAGLAAGAIEDSETDLVSFGVPYLANPDLVDRFKSGAELNQPDVDTFYTPGEKGYIDYPMLAAV